MWGISQRKMLKTNDIKGEKQPLTALTTKSGSLDWAERIAMLCILYLYLHLWGDQLGGARHQG